MTTKTIPSSQPKRENMSSYHNATALFNVTSGTGVDTYGSWVELISSISEAIIYLESIIGIHEETTPVSDTTLLPVFSIGIGSAGNEVEIIEIASDAFRGTNSSITYNRIMVLLNGIEIEGNQRLAIRAKDNTSNGFIYRLGVNYSY